MSVFVIADLHLSTNSVTNKSMEVFGKRWIGYTEKLRKNWEAVVTDEDLVIVPGDISWALTPEEAVPDLLFLDHLPGRKLIGKGNHDYWWATAKKLNGLFAANGIGSLSLFYNNAVDCGDFIAAGTRGWFNDDSLKMPPNADYAKLVNRENERLKLSLAEAARLGGANGREVIAFLHFPPVRGAFVCRPLVDTLKSAGVTRCFYGHIHGDYLTPQTAEFEGISFSLIAADYLNFLPMPIFPEK